MYGSDPKVRLDMALVIVSCLVIGTWTPSAARAQGCHGGPADHSQHSHRDSDKCCGEHGPCQTAGVSIEEGPPHGGQVSTDFLYFFEVVYQPNQTHVYVYGPAQEPLLSGNVRGEVLMRPHYLEQTFRFPLRFDALPSSSADQNHLATNVDVSRVRDGDMTVTFRFENLPLRPQPKATVTQTFALTRRPPQVVVVTLNEDDAVGLQRQKVCPVTKAPLGSMGTPIKVLITDQPLYLCCRGCVNKVEERPEAYLPAARIGQPSTQNDFR